VCCDCLYCVVFAVKSVTAAGVLIEDCSQNMQLLSILRNDCAVLASLMLCIVCCSRLSSKVFIIGACRRARRLVQEMTGLQESFRDH
jgi:hypothetical protein